LPRSRPVWSCPPALRPGAPPPPPFTQSLFGLDAFHWAISASEILWPSARVLGASLGTCTVVLLSHNLTVLSPLVRVTEDCCAGGLWLSALAVSVAASSIIARKNGGSSWLCSGRVRSIAGKRGWDRHIALAAAAQIAGFHLHGIAVPQVVKLVDEAVRMHGNRTIAEAVVRVEWIRAIHLHGQRRQALWSVGPRPRGREHAVELDIADAIGQHLMRVTMQHRDAIDAADRFPRIPRSTNCTAPGTSGPTMPRMCRRCCSASIASRVLHGHTHQVLTNRIGNIQFHGMLSTAWPWPYAPQGLPALTVQMNRPNPFDSNDGPRRWFGYRASGRPRRQALQPVEPRSHAGESQLSEQRRQARCAGPTPRLPAIDRTRPEQSHEEPHFF